MKKNTILILCFIYVLINITIFAEGNLISRVEMADIIMDTYEYITQRFSMPITESEIFTDVHDLRVIQAYSYRFMNGTGYKIFTPNQNVNKEQAATIIFRMINRLNQENEKQIKNLPNIEIADYENISPWATDAVRFLTSINFMSLTDGNFEPKKDISVDELIGMLEKIKAFYVCEDEQTERIDFETFLERVQNKRE